MQEKAKLIKDDFNNVLERLKKENQQLNNKLTLYKNQIRKLVLLKYLIINHTIKSKL